MRVSTLPNAVIAGGLLIAANGQPARAAPTTITCTNPGSAAAWEVRLDFDRGEVDGFPARITDRWISWHDTLNGGYYDLDRASGALTVRFASSTGGYFLHDTCQPAR
ncbi:MAG: hypothetical protein P4L90_21585 [Rhodopila sp.]|nr:hypothetical protein [Rhodopila sp.]